MKLTRTLLAATLTITLGLAPAFAEESIQSKVLTLVSKMSPEQQQALYDFLTKVGGPAATAAAPTAVSPEKALADMTAKLKAAATKGDLEGMMALVDDSFQQSQLGGKDALKSVVGALVATGELARYAGETTIDTSKAKITTDAADKNKVTVAPVSASGSWGSETLSFTAKLVGNDWKITGAELN